MTITDQIFQVANSILGVEGQPRRVIIQGELINTGALAWPLPTGSEGAMGFLLAYNELARLYYEHLKSGNTVEAEQVASRMRSMSAPYQPTMVAGLPVLDISDLTPENPYEGVNKLWWDLKTHLREDPVVVYRTDLHWMTYDVAIAETLVIAPGEDQFEILDVERTHGANWGFETEDLKAELKRLDHEYGLDVIGADFDTLEFLLQRSPEGDEIQRLGERLFEFCPDIGEVPRDFSKRRVALYWD